MPIVVSRQPDGCEGAMAKLVNHCVSTVGEAVTDFYGMEPTFLVQLYILAILNRVILVRWTHSEIDEGQEAASRWLAD